jgi:uncharacterized protein
LNKIVLQIADELSVHVRQVQAAVELLDGGATVPFIARYRKEATGGLDDVQLRELDVRLAYLRELEERRAAVIKSIDEQGKLTQELRASLEAAPTKQELEDLYLPFKPKRRTKGMIAREAGLEPLALRLFADPTLVPALQAQAFINADAGFADVPAVLDGVRDILSEQWAEDARVVGALRDWLWSVGLFSSRFAPGKRSFATTSITTSPSTACHLTARWRCFAGAAWRSWTPSCAWTKRFSPGSPALPKGTWRGS